MTECSEMRIDGTDPVITTAQWLVSFSTTHKRRPTNAEARFVRRPFDMTNAEEDNHENGIARKLFLICDPSLRARHQVCACKDEVVHVEPDGYAWSEKVGQ